MGGSSQFKMLAGTVIERIWAISAMKPLNCSGGLSQNEDEMSSGILLCIKEMFYSRFTIWCYNSSMPTKLNPQTQAFQPRRKRLWLSSTALVFFFFMFLGASCFFFLFQGASCFFLNFNKLCLNFNLIMFSYFTFCSSKQITK